MHPAMKEYLDHLRAQGKHETVRGYTTALKNFSTWLERDGLDPMAIGVEQLVRFQMWLSRDYHSADGASLKTSTLATRLATIKDFYGWCARRGKIVLDPSRRLKLPKVVRGLTKKDFLELQEATALLQTQAGIAQRYPEGCFRWAKEVRSLAILCVALATGRRLSHIRSLKIDDINFPRAEIRYEREKGKAGRVLPVVAWAMTILQTYVEKARPVLNWHGDVPWLFVGDLAPRIGKNSVAKLIDEAVKAAVEQNPDLEDFAKKHISTHCLRVSYAAMLFEGGCNIRSINELMNHERLTTTANYTPIPTESLRQVFRAAHPRA